MKINEGFRTIAMFITIGFVSVTILPGLAYAGLFDNLIKNQIQAVDRAVADQKRAVERAANEAKKIQIESQREAAQAALKAIEVKSAQVEEKAKILAQQSEKLEQERQTLENDKKLLLGETEKLKKEKTALENRERFLSTGFYASSLAGAVAILGIIIRLPTSRLERKLKRLEIAALEAKLSGIISSDQNLIDGNA